MIPSNAKKSTEKIHTTHIHEVTCNKRGTPGAASFTMDIHPTLVLPLKVLDELNSLL